MHLTYILFKNMQSPKNVIAIDQEKAFNRLEHNYIISALKKMNSQNFLKLINLNTVLYGQVNGTLLKQRNVKRSSINRTK